MLRRFSSKLQESSALKAERRSSSLQGAAVPYHDPAADPPEGSVLLTQKSKSSSQGKASIVSRGSSDTTGSDYQLLLNAAASGDVDSAKSILKSGTDVNGKDQTGNTAVFLAAASGHAKMIRLLLFHGAEVELTNKDGETPLFCAVQGGHVQCVGVLLEYMHSVDKRMKEPFILLRTRRMRGGVYDVENYPSCRKLGSIKKRGGDLIQTLVAHSQRADDINSSFSSAIDVPVQNVFLVGTLGEIGNKNMGKIFNRAQPEAFTVLNSICRSVEMVNFTAVKTLIFFSCHVNKLLISSLPNLELLDVRYNRITVLTEDIRTCPNLKFLKVSCNELKFIPDVFHHLRHLEWLDCSYNFIRNMPPSVSTCSSLKRLYCDHNMLADLPVDLGVMSKLEDLSLDNNKLSQLPLSLAALTKLRKITFHSNPLQNIPVDFPERAAEVRGYLESLQNDPVPNRTVKLILVGQEGVGKSTLLKALKRTFWAIPRTHSTQKTDGVEVKDITLDDLTLRCFDCGGDVDFNETHNFFITQGALYLACFSLEEYCVSTVERSSFLLGRLQLWLQYIFSKVPNSSVIIVATHADHPSLGKKNLQSIWDQLRAMLSASREYHRSYFQNDRLHDCLLCQNEARVRRQVHSGGSGIGWASVQHDPKSSSSSESAGGKSTNAAEASLMSFPHILGYYEVSSVKALGKANPTQVNVNQSIELLKNAIRTQAIRMINRNPEIPRKWADAFESMRRYNEFNPNHWVVELSEIARICRAHCISSRAELVHLLQFLKAQGNVLYFPQLEDMDETVILDPEWLAKIFAAVVSYKDTGMTNEGFIDHVTLKRAWHNVDPALKNKLITLLRHFGVCIPIVGAGVELFPCKLPIGEPDELLWSRIPPQGVRQVTYCITFPNMIPPPLFSDLIVAVFRLRADVPQSKASYYANHLVDVISLDRIGCKDCKLKFENAREGDPALNHGVHYELVAHKRSVFITTRGTLPCCAVRKAARILNKVVGRYEGLRSVSLDSVVCPGCYLQKTHTLHKYNPKALKHSGKASSKIICPNGHVIDSLDALITGVVSDTYVENLTMKRPGFESPRNGLPDVFSGCPRLFILLPVNKDGTAVLAGDRVYTSGLVFDGFAAHLLCEFPDGFHLTSSPGYRVKSPEAFMQRYGAHVINVLRLLKQMTGSSVAPKRGLHSAVSHTVDDIVKDLQNRFPAGKDKTKNPPAEQLLGLINEFSKKLSRQDLKGFLHIVDKAESFGPLRRLIYGGSTFWLCSNHFKQLRVLSIGTIATHKLRESPA